jgi:hypothetical protein
MLVQARSKYRSRRSATSAHASTRSARRMRDCRGKARCDRALVMIARRFSRRAPARRLGRTPDAPRSSSPIRNLATQPTSWVRDAAPARCFQAGSEIDAADFSALRAKDRDRPADQRLIAPVRRPAVRRSRSTAPAGNPLRIHRRSGRSPACRLGAGRRTAPIGVK